MGDIKRKQKKFSRPKQLFDRARIDEENLAVKKYGLKNKREIWKAESQISRLRRRAKKLIPKTDEEKKEFFEQLKRKGFKVNEIADVLGLTKEDWLDRRLQSVVANKKLANTPKQARQLIVHKKILVDGKVVNKPSFFVSADLESKISVKTQKPKPKKEEKVEETLDTEAPAEEVKEENAAEAKE
jgi:small subunit ribosomal protein S4